LTAIWGSLAIAVLLSASAIATEKDQGTRLNSDTVMRLLGIQHNSIKN
jgi:hypothetical protein